MPNTLAHIGAQGAITRLVVRDADEKWIYAGAIIPDAGWILQRIAEPFIGGMGTYDLRLYAIGQTSLVCSLLLAGALSMFSANTLKTFAILTLNVVLHLLLDGSEIKWANGVVLFAPFEWRPLNWGWFWPEDWPVHLLTAVGAIYLILTVRRAVTTRWDLHWPGPSKVALACGLMGVFLLAPWMWRDGALEANSHYVGTLSVGRMTGAPVELDRVAFRPDAGGVVESSLLLAPVPVQGLLLERPSVVSIRGRFSSANTIHVQDYHDHGGRGRDVPTVLALGYVLAVCVISLLRRPPRPAV